MRILFVCTGNTCRSPMAEALLRHLAATRGKKITVASAGTGASDGAPAAAHAQTVMLEWGTDLSGHLSRRLTAEMVHAADAVLVMTRPHQVQARALAPDAAEKIFVIGEYANPEPAGADIEIPDPVGGPLEYYRDTAAALADHLKIILAYLWDRLPASGLPTEEAEG